MDSDLSRWRSLAHKVTTNDPSSSSSFSSLSAPRLQFVPKLPSKHAHHRHASSLTSYTDTSTSTSASTSMDARAIDGYILERSIWKQYAERQRLDVQRIHREHLKAVRDMTNNVTNASTAPKQQLLSSSSATNLAETGLNGKYGSRSELNEEEKKVLTKSPSLLALLESHDATTTTTSITPDLTSKATGNSTNSSSFPTTTRKSVHPPFAFLKSSQTNPLSALSSQNTYEAVLKRSGRYGIGIRDQYVRHSVSSIVPALPTSPLPLQSPLPLPLQSQLPLTSSSQVPNQKSTDTEVVTKRDVLDRYSTLFDRLIHQFKHASPVLAEIKNAYDNLIHSFLQNEDDMEKLRRKVGTMVQETEGRMELVGEEGKVRDLMEKLEMVEDENHRLKSDFSRRLAVFASCVPPEKRSQLFQGDIPDGIDIPPSVSTAVDQVASLADLNVNETKIRDASGDDVVKELERKVVSLEKEVSEKNELISELVEKLGSDQAQTGDGGNHNQLTVLQEKLNDMVQKNEAMDKLVEEKQKRLDELEEMLSAQRASETVEIVSKPEP